MDNWQDAEQHVDKALELYERGRWAEAEHELRQALEIDPDQGDWHFNLGLTLERTGRDAEALACFEQASRLLPDAVDPKLAVGATCLRLARFSEAEKCLELALALKQSMEQAWAMLIDAQSALGKFDEAETSFYLAQDALPDQSASVLVAMSCSLSAQGKLDRAIWCAREAIKIDSSVVGGRLQLANALVAFGQGQQASQILLQELREDPGNVQALLLHADVLAGTGRTSEAIVKLHRVLELEPANIEAHIRAGNIAMESKRWEEAFIAWGLVKRLHPSHPTATLYLAQSLIAMHRFEAARPLLQEYREQLSESTSIEHRLQVSELLLTSGDASDAILLLEPIARENGMDAISLDVLRLLALAYFAKGKIDEGVSTSRKVLRYDERCLASMHNLALASIKNKRYRMAWGWVNKGLSIDPYDEELRRLRSRLIWNWIGQSIRKLVFRAN